MIYFECDYHEGAHPRIIEKLCETNFEQSMGYGVDAHCEKAKEHIKNAFDCKESDVHFLVGGTQANTTVISSVLRPYQGVICAETGHINVHETGAIESTGHKVLALESGNGKISAEQVEKYISGHFSDEAAEHMVQPGMVYISHPTEGGTLYTKGELEELYAVCKKYSVPLFIDGARLGYGLAAKSTDIRKEDIAKLCDIFYVGGTKVGALFGEAVVIVNKELKRDFRYFIKRHGGLLAKGRLLGIQFEELFCDGLYFEISRHAIDEALRIRKCLEECGIEVLFESDTNQQFPIFDDEVLKKLSEKYTFCFWKKVSENKSAVRICTSWATKKENTDRLICDIKKLFS
jgi:threonine aldolase